MRLSPGQSITFSHFPREPPPHSLCLDHSQTSDGTCLAGQASIQSYPLLREGFSSVALHHPVIVSSCPFSFTDMIFITISSTCVLSVFTPRMSAHERLCLVQQRVPGTMFATQPCSEQICCPVKRAVSHIL